jgi:putative tryptophan/tyrosine transport system substrate-binding protein
MKRREFVTLLGGLAAAYPLAARAQQASMQVIGLLSANQFDDRELAAVRRGLGEAGYVEGRNVAIEGRSAIGQYDRLPALAADLANRRVSVILAIGGTASAVAAKKATTTIPIVFANGGDPVRVGLVSSLNRPGGNITGISFFVTTLGAKRLELLRDLVPAATAIGFLANPSNPNAESEMADVQAAARMLGRRIHLQNASSGAEVDAAFANFMQNGMNAVVVGSDAFFLNQRDLLSTLATRYVLPTMCDVREHAVAGTLISYGTDRNDAYRQAGIYTGKVLKGEKPSELPVMQSTKFELVINVKTAKAFGLTVTPSLLARADEVIE